MSGEGTDPFEVYGIPRDRWGRPLILPEGGGKPKAMTRCTTYVGCLEDTFNLSKWQQRMVALGLAARPDLLLSVSAHSDDKSQLNDICKDAMEAAAAGSAATIGTALHRLAERLDRGENVEIPAVAQADMAAYRAATAGVKWHHIEELTVHDGLSVAGTPDRIGTAPGDQRAKVWDLKTGSIDWGAGKIAMQLALYAHSRRYDPKTGERTDLDVDLDTAVIIHLPAGSGSCSLVEVDIAAGWEAVQLATQVRAWRARKDLTRPMPTPQPDDFVVLAANASSVDELTALYSRAVAEDRWDFTVKAAFSVRKAQLAGEVAA